MTSGIRLGRVAGIEFGVNWRSRFLWPFGGDEEPRPSRGLYDPSDSP